MQCLGNYLQEVQSSWEIIFRVFVLGMLNDQNCEIRANLVESAQEAMAKGNERH
jgi:hypothetical protein